MSLIMMIIMVLVGISFFTLLERKLLSYIQERKGPNKAMFMGLTQPFSDAIKLFSKEAFSMNFLNKTMYYMSPLVVLTVSLVTWIIVPMQSNLMSFKLNLLFLLCCMSLMSYPILMAGWASNNLYSILGAIRAVAQIISYEVSMMLILMSLILMTESYSLKSFMLNQPVPFMIMMSPVFLMYFISILAELNRAPFDFIEGESELVSGFNTEFYGGGFSLLFMGEYCSMIFQSYLMVILFWGPSNQLMFVLLNQIFMISFICARGIAPRGRFDHLMMMCWKILLPVSITTFIVVISIKWIMCTTLML